MDEKRGDRGSQKPADTPAHPQSEKIDRKEKRFFTAQFAAVASLLTLLNLFISALGSGLVSRFHVILRYRREPFAEKLDLRFSIVNISTATFECSAPDLDQLFFNQQTMAIDRSTRVRLRPRRSKRYGSIQSGRYGLPPESPQFMLCFRSY